MLNKLKIWLGLTPSEVVFEKNDIDKVLKSLQAPAKKVAKKAPAKKAPAKKAPAKKVAKKAPAKKAPAKKSSGGGKGSVAL